MSILHETYWDTSDVDVHGYQLSLNILAGIKHKIYKSDKDVSY